MCNASPYHDPAHTSLYCRFFDGFLSVRILSITYLVLWIVYRLNLLTISICRTYYRLYSTLKYHVPRPVTDNYIHVQYLGWENQYLPSSNWINCLPPTQHGYVMACKCMHLVCTVYAWVYTSSQSR